MKNNKQYTDKKNVKRSTGQKSEPVEVKCIASDESGRGLIEYENKRISIPYLIEGEKALVRISKQGKRTNAKIVSIKEKSKNRVVPKCKYFYECGGCQLQHLSYEAQLSLKENYVRNLMKPFGKVQNIISMEKPYDYRNKIHSAFAVTKDREIVSGFYKEFSHDIIPIERCIIQDERADKILKTIRELVKSFKIKPYKEDYQEGFLRHVLIKTGFKSNQIMVVFVVSNKIFPSKNNFMKVLREKHPEISTIVMNINNKSTSVVLGNNETVVYGKGVIEDTLCGFTFQISAKSFYQINPVQTEKLYNKAIEFADLKGNEVVLDAYSGIGTISLIASKKASEVIGVEINRDAVKNAIKNTRINKVDNVKFYQGDAGEFMMALANDKTHIDTVFMDPPRNGSDEKFLSSIANLKPKKVVYISCNPTTQARDLKYLTSRGYRVDKIQPVDMFPHTSHVECCVLLVKNK